MSVQTYIILKSGLNESILKSFGSIVNALSALSTSTVAGLEHQAVGDSQGKPEQAVAGEGKPVPEEGSPGVAAEEDSPGGAVAGNPELDSPAAGAGSTAAGGTPVLEEVADIHMGCSPLAWVCKADRAWA